MVMMDIIKSVLAEGSYYAKMGIALINDLTKTRTHPGITGDTSSEPGICKYTNKKSNDTHRKVTPSDNCQLFLVDIIDIEEYRQTHTAWSWAGVQEEKLKVCLTQGCNRQAPRGKTYCCYRCRETEGQDHIWQCEHCKPNEIFDPDQNGQPFERSEH